MELFTSGQKKLVLLRGTLTEKKIYSFNAPLEELEQKSYVLQENGYDETGYPEGYDYGKGFPLFIIYSKTVV